MIRSSLAALLRVAIAGALCACVLDPDRALAQSTAASLRIVVIEGEDAVNVIRQKTAVAPVVEVRDRNDQPVAGAVVRFAIQSGRASFGGARTLTVTTNAVGRAAVTSLTPTSSGALQITASAAFQGQTAAVTIAQTNVLTAAEAATAAGAGGGGSGAGAGAGGATGGGTGGGLSATTIGIVGGAAAGGALIVKEVVLPQGTAYAGPYGGTWDVVTTSTNPPVNCRVTTTTTMTMTIHLSVDGGSVQGQAEAKGTEGDAGSTCGPGQLGKPFDNGWGEAELSGTTSNITFTYVDDYAPPGGTQTATYVFAGTLDGEVITGTLTRTDRQTNPSLNLTGFGSIVFPVTLRKQ